MKLSSTTSLNSEANLNLMELLKGGSNTNRVSISTTLYEQKWHHVLFLVNETCFLTMKLILQQFPTRKLLGH